MRISDWSSDVCSSDLLSPREGSIPVNFPPPFRNRTANAGRSRLYAGCGGKRLKQVAFRADDADLAASDLDALGERSEARRVVTECVSTWRFRWSQAHQKKNRTRSQDRKQK